MIGVAAFVFLRVSDTDLQYEYAKDWVKGRVNAIQSGPVPQPIEKESIPTYDVGEIANTYNVNPFDADEKFKGRTIQVKGEVVDMGYDVLEKKNYIKLSNGERGFRAHWMFCIIRDRDADQFANVKRGRVIEVKGEGLGRKSPLTFDFYAKDCTFVRDAGTRISPIR